MTFCVFEKEWFHDGDVVGLIFKSLSVLSMKIPGFCNVPQEKVKRAINRAMGSKNQSFALLSRGGHRDFLEHFLPLRSTYVSGICSIRDK